MKELTAERLRELLDYDQETGVFTRKVKLCNRVQVGDVAGGFDAKGYWRIRIDGHKHLAHRLAWLFVYGEWPTADIDHINGSHADNRIVNLRLATHSENMHNRRKPHANNKTGYLGVSPRYGKFLARIRLDGKLKHLGVFPTPEAAHAAYLAAKRRLHPFGTI